MAWLKQGLLIAGGLYLCWLGYQMLRSAFSKNQQEDNVAVELPKAPYLFFIKGLITNLSNPKAVIYFGSVFSLFLTNPQLDQVHWLLFIIVTVETILWFCFVTFIFHCQVLDQLIVIFQNGLMVFLVAFLLCLVFSSLEIDKLR